MMFHLFGPTSTIICIWILEKLLGEVLGQLREEDMSFDVPTSHESTQNLKLGSIDAYNQRDLKTR